MNNGNTLLFNKLPAENYAKKNHFEIILNGNP